MEGFQVFNNLKRTLSLVKTITPPLEFLSNLNGFAKPEIINCFKGNTSSTFVSDYKRTSISGFIKEVIISNLFAAISTAFLICFLKREGGLLRLVYVTVISLQKVVLIRTNRYNVNLVSRVSYVTKLRTWFPYCGFKNKD